MSAERNNGLNIGLVGKQYLGIIYRHKLIILVLFASIMFTLLVGLYLWPETYEAKAKVLVKVGRENISMPALAPATQQQLIASLGLRKEDINSEIEILRSRVILEDVINKIGTDTLFPVAAEPTTVLKKIKYELKKAYRAVKTAIDELMYMADLKKRLTLHEKALLSVSKNLSVKQVSNSDVIEISFFWYSPDIAAKVLNAIVEFYLQHHLEAHRVEGAYQVLHREVSTLENKLKESENALQRLKEEQGITSYEEQKAALLKQVTTFRASLKDTETDLSESRKMADELTLKKASLVKKITPGFNTVYKEIEKDLVLQDVKLKGLRVKKEMLEGHIASYQKDIERLNEDETKLKRLIRQIQIDEENYNLYRRKLEEARVSDVLDVERIVNVKIIEPPNAFFIPIWPKKTLTLGIGAIVSLIIGISFGFLAEYIGGSSINAPESVVRQVSPENARESTS